MKLSEKKKYIDSINKILEPIKSDRELLEVLGDLLIDYDLRFLGNLIKEGYEPSITSQSLCEEYCYTEGNEDMGHIPLGKMFTFIEEILNTADTERYIKFNDYFMRLETEEEIKASGRPTDVVWFTKGEDIDLNKLVSFEVSG